MRVVGNPHVTEVAFRDGRHLAFLSGWHADDRPVIVVLCIRTHSISRASTLAVERTSSYSVPRIHLRPTGSVARGRKDRLFGRFTAWSICSNLAAPFSAGDSNLGRWVKFDQLLVHSRFVSFASTHTHTAYLYPYPVNTVDHIVVPSGHVHQLSSLFRQTHTPCVRESVQEVALRQSPPASADPPASPWRCLRCSASRCHCRYRCWWGSPIPEWA